MPPEDNSADGKQTEPCPECGSPTIFDEDEDSYYCSNKDCDWLMHGHDKHTHE
jgi:NAD-dependent DNA ligase C4 zinc finger domain